MGSLPFSLAELYSFILKAAEATYAIGGGLTDNIERPGFIELVFEEEKFSYRDSYTGYFRSRGTEVVRYKGTPVWSSLYGGGMLNNDPQLTQNTFNFLKQALIDRKKASFQSLRGPSILEKENWKYTYTQEGNVDEFYGYEQIFFEGQEVFFHRVIGGKIINL